MAKNKKPVEKEEEVKIETTEMVDETGTVDITPEQFQELVSGGNSVSTFSYGLAESMFMEDIDNRIFYIDGEINEDIFREINVFIMKINAADAGLSKEERLPIKIVISSGGGSVFDGLGTVNCITNSTTPIIAICTSYACSMAFYIFVSAHIRIATKDTVLLNHDGTTGILDSTSKTEDTIEFYKKIHNRLHKMVASRSKLTMKELSDTRRIENYYFGDEAKDLGLVDMLIGQDVTFEDVFAVYDDCACDCEECREI